MGTENYTDEQTDELVAAYKAAHADGEGSDDDRAAVVEEFSERFGKSPASIRQKLVREGVYVAKTRKTKTGEPVERKEDIVQNIAEILGKPVDVVGSLEKATKKALTTIRAALAANATD